MFGLHNARSSSTSSSPVDYGTLKLFSFLVFTLFFSPVWSSASHLTQRSSFSDTHSRLSGLEKKDIMRCVRVIYFLWQSYSWSLYAC